MTFLANGDCGNLDAPEPCKVPRDESSPGCDSHRSSRDWPKGRKHGHKEALKHRFSRATESRKRLIISVLLQSDTDAVSAKRFCHHNAS